MIQRLLRQYVMLLIFRIPAFHCRLTPKTLCCWHWAVLVPSTVHPIIQSASYTVLMPRNVSSKYAWIIDRQIWLNQVRLAFSLKTVTESFYTKTQKHENANCWRKKVEKNQLNLIKFSHVLTCLKHSIFWPNIKCKPNPHSLYGLKECSYYD